MVEKLTPPSFPSNLIDAALFNLFCKEKRRDKKSLVMFKWVTVQSLFSQCQRSPLNNLQPSNGNKTHKFMSFMKPRSVRLLLLLSMASLKT